MPARRRATTRRAKKKKIALAENRAIEPGVPDSSAPQAGTTAGSSSYQIQLRYYKGATLETLTIPVNDRSFYPIVQRWRYVVANRRRITRASRDELSEDILKW